MQFISKVIVPVLLVATVIESNDSDWSIQWYIGEPYQLECDLGNGTNAKIVQWDTPTRKNISWPVDDVDFLIMGNDSSKLLIKSISRSLHGVYICTIYDAATSTREGRYMYGINIYEAKHRDWFDKYKYNLTVAGISTGSFLALVILVGLVWNFRFISEDDKRNDVERKHAQHRMYAGNAPQEHAAHDNRGYDTSTQL